MSNKPDGYWCPVCGDLKETASPFPWLEGAAYRHVDCGVHGDQIIPVYTPLAVPEVTTWDSPELVTVTDPDGIHWVAAPCSGYKLTATGKKILDVWSEKNRAVGLWEGNESLAINYVAGAK